MLISYLSNKEEPRQGKDQLCICKASTFCGFVGKLGDSMLFKNNFNYQLQKTKQ